MKDKVILILALSVFVLSSGKPECDLDPCRDLSTAKNCDKVKFCIAEHWSKLTPTGNRDNVCDICLRMVKEARDTLQSNETREQLLQVFEGSCRLLVLKPAVEACDKIVDEFVPELVEILSSQMDPETVCSVAKLCNNEVFRTAQKDSKECTSCRKFTESAAKDMENISLEQFKNKMLYLCRSANTYSDACSHAALEYSNLLYNSSKIILNKKPCEAMSLCPSGLVYSESAPEAEEEMCPLCLDFLTNFREHLLRVKSAEEFEDNILSVCGRMDFPDSACSKIFNPSLFEKLKGWNTIPSVLCKITYCRNKSEDESVPFWPLIPAHNGSFSSVKDLDAVELLENVQMFFPATVEEKTELRKTISYGDPIANPVFFTPSLSLDFKVDEFGTPSKSAESFVDFSEDNTCTLCLNTARIFKYGDSVSVVIQSCCTFSAGTEQHISNIEDAKKSFPVIIALTENEFIIFLLFQGSWSQVLMEKCSTLPENSREICTSSLARIPFIFKNYTGHEICNSLKYCSSSTINPSNTSNTHAESTRSCNICLNTLQKLSDLAKDPNSEFIIHTIFDSLCALLPYNEFEMCRKFVEVIGIGELKKLLENLKPKEICIKIHLCEYKAELDFTTVPDEPTKATGTDTSRKVPCKFCLMAVKTLLDELQDDKTEESIRKALNSLCRYFPEETRDACRNLVDEYTEDLIDMIIADFNASEICMYLKICPPQHLFGDAFKKDFAVFDIFTNEVRDENSWKLMLGSFDQRDASASLEKPREEDLQRFHEFVQECALCEALVGVISTHKKMLDKNYDFAANAEHICFIVPPNKRKKCMSMIVSYGPSIVNLLVDQKVDPNDVCVRVDLCDPKMQAKVSLPVSVDEDKFISDGKNDCMRGPVFWCANAENAEKCGTFLHCQETVWKNWKNPPRKPIKG